MSFGIGMRFQPGSFKVMTGCAPISAIDMASVPHNHPVRQSVRFKLLSSQNFGHQNDFNILTRVCINAAACNYPCQCARRDKSIIIYSTTIDEDGLVAIIFQSLRKASYKLYQDVRDAVAD